LLSLNNPYALLFMRHQLKNCTPKNIGRESVLSYFILSYTS
jgi:hypothetical protein